MRYPLLAVLAMLLLHVQGQKTCSKSSPLFRFEPGAHPRLFTEKLGNHPQFPFLQAVNGIITIKAFDSSVHSSGSRSKYVEEFKIFDGLLKDIGFVRGYKDLHVANIRNGHVQDGTIGNLGFYNRDKPEYNYIYVRLNPAGEGRTGVPAWKITGPGGCSFYILHTCGNAFFQGHEENDCCKMIQAETRINPVEWPAAGKERPLRIRINFYQARIAYSTRHGRQVIDTIISLLRSIDTTSLYHDSVGKPARISAKDLLTQFMVCRDTVWQMRPQLIVDSMAGPSDSLFYQLSDTLYVRDPGKGETPCHKKWEVALDGGLSYNSIPRFDNTTTHTRTDGSHPVAELAIARIFSPHFAAGISAAYFQLSYQDDVPYTGSAPNTYNTVYVGKPLIPVQLFGKATIGGPLGWQSTVSLSAGYAFVRGDKILNSGNTLSTKPGTKGGPTAGAQMGLAYFFSCKFGLSLSVGGQYFSNKAAAMNYHLMALPVTLGIRYRF